MKQEIPKTIVLSPEDAIQLGQKYGHPKLDTPYVGDDYVVYKLKEMIKD